MQSPKPSPILIEYLQNENILQAEIIADHGENVFF